MRLLPLLLASLFASSAYAGEASIVTIQKFAFSPMEITIAPGTKITWINKDETPHTVNTADKSFLSKALDTDDKFEYTFVKEGDFSYFCTLHPFMTGIVHVHSGAASARK